MRRIIMMMSRLVGTRTFGNGVVLRRYERAQLPLTATPSNM
jgi:hypothetical protein